MRMFLCIEHLFSPQPQPQQPQSMIRLANNQKEYSTCKQLLDVSQYYYVVDPHTATHRFLYSMIRDHEVFKNPMFWEMNFLDTYPSERHRLSVRRWSTSAANADASRPGMLCPLLPVLVLVLCCCVWFASFGVCTSFDLLTVTDGMDGFHWHTGSWT